MDSKKGDGVRLELAEAFEKPGPYTMSYGFNLDILCESIRKVGLINPPLVSRNRDGVFEIVSGYRRIMALRTLGELQIFCYDVTQALRSPAERFFAAFYENLATRKFNDVEKAILLAGLQDYVTREEILTSYMPLLSLPSHEGTLKSYMKLLDLEENVRNAIAVEELSMNVAKALVEMEKDSRQTLFHWIQMLKLNFNYQSKFVEYLQDISARENVKPSEALSERSCSQIIENPRLNTPQKAKAVLEVLRARRSPRLAQAQAIVERNLSAISLPKDASIHYDPGLEDPYYHLDVRFRHGEDLKKTIDELHRLDELEAIPAMWAT
ncbi:MAG: ParB/RepB/Spo0J family partition protein [Deltaproteobacteria bacterium]